MKTHDSYHLFLTPLSPVHIGTGESYEPTQYVIDDEGVFNEFDTGGVMRVLGDADRRQLLKIVEGKPGTDMIRDLQRFFYQKRALLVDEAINCIPVLAGFTHLYRQRIGQVAQQEQTGLKLINRLEIDRCAYHPGTRKPVMYGSSLKGSIRTALLDGVNQGQPAREQKGLHEFQGRLFSYLNDRGRPTDLERDPLRLLQISDAGWAAPREFPAAEVYLAVNRKKALVRDREGREVRAMGENLYQILECVSGWQYRAFSGQLNLQCLAAAGDGRQRDRRTLPEFRFDLADIAKACNNFYRPILKAEIQELKNRGYLNSQWAEAIEQVFGLTKQRTGNGVTFLLRVGRHSGAQSVTLNGVRKIRIMKGRGQPPEQAEAAKTWWLAASDKDQSQDLLPFGWVLMEALPMHADIPDWPELAALCTPWRKSALEFAATQRTRLAEREQRQIERQKQADALRQQAEAEVQAEATESARIASLSENQRELENLLARCTPANRGRGPGDQLYGQIREKLQSGIEWDEVDRRALYDKAVAIFDHLGIARDNKNRKALLRGLGLTV